MRQFNLIHLLLSVMCIAVVMAGFTLGGFASAVVILLLLGVAVTCCTLTIMSWSSATKHERHVSAFATTVSVMALVFFFFSLIARTWD